ncbi:MAG: WG repeat-containing protein, partial [Coprothermobacterota bacterium]|nr:WG repeat-containing protein [Coprothermobacterota bacterium]
VWIRVGFTLVARPPDRSAHTTPEKGVFQLGPEGSSTEELSTNIESKSESTPTPTPTPTPTLSNQTLFVIIVAGKRGYIDKNGQIVINPQFEYARGSMYTAYAPPKRLEPSFIQGGGIPPCVYQAARNPSNE